MTAGNSEAALRNSIQANKPADTFVSAGFLHKNQKVAIFFFA